MAASTYPPLSTLLPTAGLGSSGAFGQLSFLDGAGQAVGDFVADVLEPLRYRDFSIERSESGDIGVYRFTVVTEDPLKLDLLAGLRLVLLPDAGSGPATASSVGVIFAYEWPIRAYLKRFRPGSDPARAAFDLFLHLAGITDQELYARLVAILAPSANDYVWLIGKISDWSGDFTSPTPVAGTEIQQILDTLETAGLDPYEAAFEAVVKDAAGFDLDLVFTRLRDLFEELVGQIDRQDVEALLLPQFSVTLDSLSAAIEFPANVLTPLDGSPLSRLTFTTGGLTYDTRTGFDIAVDEGLGVSLTPSAIGKTGLTLQIEGCKLDLSPRYNIPEAIADMRPPDFMGVYFKALIIGLPAKWFSQPTGTTLGIVGRNLLIGTGGVSGTIGLEALAGGKPAAASAPAGGTELQFVLGKAPAPGEDRKGYIVGFSAFDMKFRQNRLLESRIKGSLTLPGFDPADPQGNRIDIALFLDNDGDFEVTASIAGGRKLNVPGVFSFNLISASVGKDDRGVYVRCSGDLSFENNNLLKTLIKQPIHLDELMVHSDGSVSLKGGKVVLPKAVVLPVGPAKISITAVHFGALEQEHKGVMRKYRYIGFDGAVSVNPGAIGGQGDGICFCYSVDGLAFHSFLRIDGIGIKMMIPGSATPESAMLLLEGYLSLKEPEYAGTLKFGLPKLKIFGGASMRYNTRIPAWIVRVDLELPKALPLGSTGLGVYSFSGLFGLRFMAAKAAINPPLAADASWGDYYRGPPARGISVQKFLPPDKTAGSRNPFSVGVGVGLCTASDNGKVFSAQLFLLVSLPNLIMLEGAGDVLADKRVSITDDPPYYAYIALSPGESIELGVGVNYLIPKDSGKVLNLTAVLEAAFFFRNASAWYVNFGTRNKPAHADILGLFNGYAYLMLSASGIETGAGVSFDFNKRYGPIAIDAHAYLDFWAYIAFERFQAGGGIAMGGYLDVKCCGFGFNISLAAALAVEAPKPFRVAGSVEVCVTIKILKKKISKCCELSFVWETGDSVNTSPVPVLTDGGPPAASAVHMVSGSTYDVVFSTSPDPPPNAPSLPGLPPIPIDCFIDVKFTKPVDPSRVPEIGGHTGPALGATEKMPPRYGTQIVDHSYALEKVALQVRENGNWVDYHPYAALAPEGLLDATVAAQLATMPLGVWQKQEQGYSQIRFLALTPFSWMGPMVGHRPEELGVTPQSTYCVGRMRERRCVTWTEPKAYLAGLDYLRDGILYRVDGDRMEAAAFTAPRLQPVSLAIGPSGQASFQFLEPVAECSIDLVTTAPWVKLRWQRRKPMVVNGVLVGTPWAAPEFEDAGPPTLVPRAALTGPVAYDQPDAPIDRVLIEIPVPDPARIADLEEAIAQAEDSWMFLPAQREAIGRQLTELRAALKAEHDRTCVAGGAGGPSAEALAQLTALYEELKEALQLLQEQRQLLEQRFERFCAGIAALPPARPRAPGRAGWIAEVLNSLRKAIINALGGIIPEPGEKPEPPRMSAEECCALMRAVEEAEARIREIVAAIDALGHQGDGEGGGWPCGTFVREICRLSQKDYAYNQSLPGIDAIAADYSRMRAAVEGTIAPVWRPGESYRIRLTVSDKVNTADPFESDYYVHFRTDGPIGHFPPPLPDPDDPPPPPQPTDDERQEIPERSLRFYVDMKRSTPDPSGKLPYAKPTYTRNVQIRLFFDKPHAFHFFADWPGNRRNYALELAVKDPAESSAAANPLLLHETVIIGAPHFGAQSWQDDPAPKTSLEFRTLEAFSSPANPPDPDGNSLVCLSDGGDPIAPLARHLLVEIPELDPDKLYTAVVLNRRTDPIVPPEVAEVLSYGFKTSLFPDFATHIGSHRLEGADGAARLAVFNIDHHLPGNEAQTVAAALAIVAGGPVADRAAWPDPFDGLVYGLLDLPPLPRAATVEFNFVTALPGGTTLGLLIRSPEPFYDPRLPAATLATTIQLLDNGAARAAHVLLSRDCSQAFVMAASGAFPTQNVAIRFANLDWEGKIASPASVDSDAFSKS